MTKSEIISINLFTTQMECQRIIPTIWTLIILLCDVLSIGHAQQPQQPTLADLHHRIQQLENVTRELDRRLQVETSARQVVEQELQQKNDLIQFLQTDVTSQNSTLYQEKNARIHQDAIISDMQQKLNNIQSTLAENTAPAVKPEVAFFANRPRSARSGVFVPYFDHVITNSGSGFNPSQSLFTCPTDGVYLFTATLQKTAENISIKCWIHLNGAPLSIIEVHDEYPGNPTSATNTALVRMKKGDQVQLAMCSGDAQFSPDGTTFTGVLL